MRAGLAAILAATMLAGSELRCPHCGTAAPDDGHFCHACGAPLAAANGNTSGQGSGCPLPPSARGWTFAGFTPFGLFAFIHGSVLWGVLHFVAAPVAAIYLGIYGKQLAWRNRRFDSIEQYQATLRAWNLWGIVCLALELAVGGLCFALLVGLAVATRPQGLF